MTVPGGATLAPTPGPIYKVFIPVGSIPVVVLPGGTGRIRSCLAGAELPLCLMFIGSQPHQSIIASPCVGCLSAKSGTLHTVGLHLAQFEAKT